MKPVLLLSNGHGEDLSGSLLASALRRRGVAVEALPLVGHGEAYRRTGIPVLGRTRSFSTGGLGYTSLRGQLTELLQGQPLYLLQRLALLLRLRRRYSLVVAVGDLVPALGAWLSRRASAVYLVAYSSHYEGRLRLPWPCGWLLHRRRLRAVWSRDALTATDLSRQLGREVRFLGNPFLDPVAAAIHPVVAPAISAPAGPAAPAQQLALLPGSRLPEALQNLSLMLQLLAVLPEAWRQPGRLCLAVALVPELTAAPIAAMAAPLGWQLSAAPTGSGGTSSHTDSDSDSGSSDSNSPDAASLVGHGLELRLGWGQFRPILQGADLVVAMAGTATEQAVGLGKPVLQLAGRGPQFTAGFAEAQRRLLGPAVHCAAGPAGHADTLRRSAELLGALLDELADGERGARRRAALALEGERRLGRPGGTERMAAAIMELLTSPADG